MKQLITVSVPDAVSNAIKTGTNAKEVWDALKKLYEGCTSLILVDLGQHLQMMCCAEEVSVCDHFDKLADLCQQLVGMGKTMPDDEYNLILMGLLSLSYQATLSTISVSAEMSGTTPTPAIITKPATNEFDRCTFKEGSVKLNVTIVTKKAMLMLGTRRWQGGSRAPKMWWWSEGQ